MNTQKTMADLESEAVDALRRWLDSDHTLIASRRSGPWGDGKPVALDVLSVINALRENARLGGPRAWSSNPPPTE